MTEKSSADLFPLLGHFHALIRQRASDLIDKHRLVLPTMESIIESREAAGWFPVLGMMGGFKFELSGYELEAKLMVTSWSRVVGGSGQRHEISRNGIVLVEEGFV